MLKSELSEVETRVKKTASCVTLSHHLQRPFGAFSDGTLARMTQNRASRYLQVLDVLLKLKHYSQSTNVIT